MNGIVHWLATFAVGAVLTVGLAGCGGDGEKKDAAVEAAVADYASGVHASYEASLASATALDAAIDAFVAEPTTATLDAAQAAWLTARDDYGLTEAFRFYGGPIDDEETGLEGLMNAWPLDEAYIDYVEGNPGSRGDQRSRDIPDDRSRAARLVNEKGGEANISTGWHAIEFLLWGQDLDENGAGARPLTDYTSSPVAERRATYLTVTVRPPRRASRFARRRRGRLPPTTTGPSSRRSSPTRPCATSSPASAS